MNAEQQKAFLRQIASSHFEASEAIDGIVNRVRELEATLAARELELRDALDEKALRLGLLQAAEARETETRKLVVMLAEVPDSPHYAIDRLCEIFGVTKP